MCENINFPVGLFIGNTSYLKKFIRSNFDPLVEAVKITDVTSTNVVQVQYHCGRESAISNRDLAPSSECF